MDNDCSTMVRAKAPNTIDPLLKSNQRPISSYTTLKFVYHIDSRRREKSVEPLQSWCLRAENRISDNLFCSKSWREAWSSGSGWWLMFERSWGWIPVLYTRWTFFHINLLYTLYWLFEKTNNKQKIGRGWPIFKKSWMVTNYLKFY